LRPTREAGPLLLSRSPFVLGHEVAKRAAEELDAVRDDPCELAHSIVRPFPRPRRPRTGFVLVELLEELAAALDGGRLV
jgi:hypothetical protein